MNEDGATTERRAPPASCAACWVHGRSDWCGLDREALALHDSAREPVRIATGQTIFEQNQPSRGIYCIESGFVLLRQIDVFGNETAFRLAVHGEAIGWRSFFAEQPHAATALAVSACRACFVSGKAIRALMVQAPDLSLSLLRTLAQDRGPAEALLLRSPLVPVNVRLVHLLLLLRDRCATPVPPDGLIYDLPLKRKQIAAMIGARNETLSRAIRDLRDRGLASFDSRRVTVTDQSKLLEIANRRQPAGPAD